MIIVEDTYLEEIETLESLEMLGIGLVSILERNYNIIFRKGIGTSLLNKLIKIYKKQIIEKKEGKIVELIGSYTVYVHFFKADNEIVAIFYVNEKDKLINYNDLCLLSNKLLTLFYSNASNTKINSICNKIIPSATGISALFIISVCGHALYVKINKKKKFLAENYIQVGGFISAIMAFSKEVTGNESGDGLKAINFENEQFFIHLKGDVIFAYLVDKKIESRNLNRFIQLVAEEFVERFNDTFKNFNGDITPFSNFETVVDNYLKI